MRASPWYRRKLAPSWRWALATLGAAVLLARWVIDGTASLVVQAILVVALVVGLVLALRQPES